MSWLGVRAAGAEKILGVGRVGAGGQPRSGVRWCRWSEQKVRNLVLHGASVGAPIHLVQDVHRQLIHTPDRIF